MIPEESESVQKALKRLPPKEAYDRVYRMRRAFQVRENNVCGKEGVWRLTDLTVLASPSAIAEE